MHIWRWVVVGAALLTVAAAPAPIPGPYKATFHQDPITDELSVNLTLKTEGALMLVTCDPVRSDVSVVFQVDKYLGPVRISGEDRVVDYRFDKSPPVQSRWNHADRFAVVRYENSKGFARMLGISRTLVIRLTAFDGTRPTYTFNLAGGEKQIDKLFELCTG